MLELSSITTSISLPYNHSQRVWATKIASVNRHVPFSMLANPRHRPPDGRLPDYGLVCAGNAHSFNTTMARMLRSLSSMGQDLSRHTIITAMGALTQRMCTIVMRNGGHLGHCAMEERIGGPDGPIDWGTSW